MAGPVFGRRERTTEASVVVLDRDRALVEEARRDPARFDALYRKYLAQVYAYALYELGDHHAAEDATERVFLRALAALPRFREQARPEDGPEASTFRVWLFRIARNVVANERRSRRRRPVASLEVALGAAMAIPDATDIEAEAVTRDEAGEALRAVRALPDDRRRALTLRFVEEMSTAEIAGVLGRSEGAVRVLIHRALRCRGARPRHRSPRQVPRGDPVTGEHEVDALVADRYLDALLAAVDRHAADAPSDASLDPDIREAARVLRASLVRVHPSFRFEERLAGRLADLAAAQARPALAAAGGSGTVIAFPGSTGSALDADPLLDAILRGELDPADADAVDSATDATRGSAARRPLIVGGAITSAAISIVGVAYVAWRASRPAPVRSNRAMARAARAARARRAAGTAIVTGTAIIAALGVPA